MIPVLLALAFALAQAIPVDAYRDTRAVSVQTDAMTNEPASEGPWSLDHSSTQALREIARSFRAEKRYSQAIGIYKRILSTDRRDADAWYSLAQLYAWTGDRDKAVATFRDGIAVHRDNGHLKNGLAQVLCWMHRYDEAEVLYREILAVDRDNRDALKGLAEVLARTGNYEKAEVLIDRALRLYPRDAQLYNEKGIILAWQKKFGLAVESLSKALELSPGYGNAQESLGDVYFWMKSYRKAIEAYQKALTLNPDDLGMHLMLARAYQKIEDQQLAVQHAKRAHEINPVNIQANELLRDLEGRRWYSLEELAGHLAEYLTFGFVFSLVYLNYRRNRLILRRRHWYYHVFAHYVLPGVACLAVAFFLAETYLMPQAVLDPDIFHSIGVSVIVVILGLSFIGLLYKERQPAVASTPVVLAIGAHPDDIELGCGGYLLKEKDRGAKVYGLTLSRGERGMEGLGDRSVEQQKAADFLGLDAMWNLGMPDTDIREHQRALVETIEQKIRETGATIVLSHSPYDVHSDHQAVFDATKEAARNGPTLLCYEDVCTAKEFVPNYFVDIAEYMDDKIKLVSFHRTQKLKPYMDPVTIRGRASHRGLQSGTPFAEAFSINRILG